ncbi:MAG: hypothetical protein AAFZ07_25720 [Actinomycetota bacterium]
MARRRIDIEAVRASSQDLVDTALRVSEEIRTVTRTARLAKSTEALLHAEADRLEAAARGLMVELRLDLDLERASQWWSLLKQAAIGGGALLLGGVANEVGADVYRATADRVEMIVELVDALERDTTPDSPVDADLDEGAVRSSLGTGVGPTVRSDQPSEVTLAVDGLRSESSLGVRQVDSPGFTGDPKRASP